MSTVFADKLRFYNGLIDHLSEKLDKIKHLCVKKRVRVIQNIYCSLVSVNIILEVMCIDSMKTYENFYTYAP